MQKIISLFQRNYDGDRLVRDELVPGAEWVAKGEGVATRKLDGTCCLVKDGMLYKRYDAKNGKQPPAGFEPAQDPDEKTGHWPGWLPVSEQPEDRWHMEAWERASKGLSDGTYELIGPKVNGNAEMLTEHVLVEHGSEQFTDCPRSFAELKEFFSDRDIEGIVWHHQDGRMVKIKAKDFGLKRSRAQGGS